MEQIIFGAGCFWGVEHEFKSIEGIVETTVGYSGGSMLNPTYEQVCTGDSGHAEVVLLKYDSNKISTEDLIKKFWKIHDPTTLNKQGPDIGTQYRSVIFFFTPEQQEIALSSLKFWQQKKDKEIVTKIEKAGPFYKAEEYHQCYIDKKNNN